MGVVAASGAPVGAGDPPLRHVRGRGIFEGQVIEVAPEVGAITVQHNEPVVLTMHFTLNLATRLRRKGKPIALTDLQPGDTVRVVYTSNSDVQSVTLR